jgi:3-oxoacyl-[acyl-carrier-protein] synthase II/TetR/AcrR family transcriptional repressor of nem operon
MNTREQIIQLADNLIREKGYNAFSFYDIAKSVGIKTSSIHYHFPSKSDLGVAVIELYINGIETARKEYENKSPIENLDLLFSIYSNIKNEDKVCIVGSLAPDFKTLDEKMQASLKIFTEVMFDWVSHFLEEGRNSNVFQFECSPRTKAGMIIGNLLSIVLLSRLTSDKDFETVKETINQELIKK